MADESFQRRAWAGTGPEISSLVEVICRLFDDALFIEYKDKYKETLSSYILTNVSILDQKIKSLDTVYLDTLPVMKVIESPKWVEIRNIAGNLKLAFEQDKSVE
ncbi:hypothetical protein [Sphingomonas sp.]